MKQINTMRGITVLNLLAVALVIVFVSIIVINLLPPYLHYYSVKDAMEQIAADPEIGKMSKAKLQDLFSRKLQVNYISNIPPDTLVLIKKDEKPEALSIKYETRVHLIANIDAVVMFENEVKVSANPTP